MVVKGDPTLMFTNAGMNQFKDMFLGADPVVQGVMVLLLLASVACWVIIFEKTVILRRAGRTVWLFKRMANTINGDTLKSFPHFTQRIVEAGIRESRDAAGNETRADFRERVERAMRAILSGQLDRLESRVIFLATVGSTSPFIGLFGTVWGIMHSFVGIAATGETTLAVVAPGIAEALFATAMGLVAAIPAVIAYNKITASLKKTAKESLAAIGLVGLVSRRTLVGMLISVEMLMERELLPGQGEVMPMAEINVTPFIDIMLVLLIIFMVTAPLMLGGVHVNLPKSGGTPMPRPDTPMIVSLDAQNRIFVDKDEVAADGRLEHFKELARASETGEVYVRGDGEVKYAQMMELMGELGQAP